ncbi:hypothetical protein [Pseudonocardia sp. TRM90224]|uniref:hypothetical protein n=1 Tax=Pseudonocardia sp. TRM90224 TaxID=2812678 RepID=UPI001E60BE44|nr:hypothetical protein [Pseudonocardia sp. TRM90224]
MAITHPHWQAWLTSALHDSFLPHGEIAIDLTPQVTPTETDNTPKHAGPNTIGDVQRQRTFDCPPTASEHRDLEPPQAPCAAIVDRPTNRDGAALAIVNLDARVADRRLGRVASHALRAGGILAVLSHPFTTGTVTTGTVTAGDAPETGLADVPDQNARTHRSFIDPMGSAVTSAEHAGLIYLQHIVIPTSPLAPPDASDIARSTGQSQGEPSTALAHIDLLVFCKPDDCRRDAALSPPHSESGPAESRPAALIGVVSGDER